MYNREGVRAQVYDFGCRGEVGQDPLFCQDPCLLVVKCKYERHETLSARAQSLGIGLSVARVTGMSGVLFKLVSVTFPTCCSGGLQV